MFFEENYTAQCRHVCETGERVKIDQLYKALGLGTKLFQPTKLENH